MSSHTYAVIWISCINLEKYIFSIFSLQNHKYYFKWNLKIFNFFSCKCFLLKCFHVQYCPVTPFWYLTMEMCVWYYNDNFLSKLFFKTNSLQYLFDLGSIFYNREIWPNLFFSDMSWWRQIWKKWCAGVYWIIPLLDLNQWKTIHNNL